ncbi:YeeE/YedE family protein [Photobacterium sp. 1_MG-2023]|uniref:YeeE/YedE family protein n=1 Tax=Photobacterium sp. 1_MG-2023 TaxID=3062646 RepID=UPI0026E26526|nr:YeeE/YedE family protein [Photobacterium sp. 1_MG-2023]MDO6707560.1 YeeE/YedE family protein [Photobacterium sp. 1_MG-2023]
MTEFTPWSALMGGFILGGAALMLLVLNGRIAGISGIVSGAMQPSDPNAPWRWMFLLGLVLGPLLAAPFGLQLPEQINAGWPLILIGGFLVGLGTRLGSGCTSGHGICGIGRLSPRSIVATLIFMVVAIMVVFIVRHLIGV